MATSPAAAAAVAAFDLDGTLTSRGSVVHWLAEVGGRPRVRRAIAANLPWLAVGAVRSGGWADAAKERLFVDVLADREEAAVAAVSAAFADDHLRAHVRPEVLERLVAHLDRGHVVVLVSASPALYVDRVAEAVGAHGAAATRLEVGADGFLTGHYDGRNCRGTEKLVQVRSLLEALGVGATGPDRPLYAYGNSRGDLRLMEAADRPVDVSRLGRLGRLRRFPRLESVALA